MSLRKALTTAVILAAVAVPAIASATPLAVEHGTFISGAHATKGDASVYKLDDGSRVLRLENFETSNGPAVHVLLSSAPQIKDNGDVAEATAIDLGDLKGTSGNQNYVIPANVDLSKFHSVSIWCSRFKVNFGAAALTATK